MAVEDVYKPKTVNPIDPKNVKGKEEDKETEFQRKAKDAKAEREYLEEQRRIDRIGQPEKSKEPAFAVEGKMHLDIDPQRDAKEAREATEKIRQEAEKEKKGRDEKIEKLTAERNEKARELQDSQLTAVMKEMTGSFNAALKDMNNKLEDVKAGADPSAMVNQFTVLRKLAEEMTSLKGTHGVGDPSLQLEITKLQMDNARADREFQAKMEQDRRQWDLEKEKFQDNRYFKQQEAARQAKRDEMFANAPAVIGGAIAKGLMETGEGGVSGAPKGKAGQHVEAGVGEAGNFECSSCRQPVAIGPTAKSAVCSNCGTRFSIRRVESEVAPEEE